MIETKTEVQTPYRQHFRYRMYKLYEEAAWSDNIATVSDCRICELNSDVTEPLMTMRQDMIARGFVFHAAPVGFSSFSFTNVNKTSWKEIMFALD